MGISKETIRPFLYYESGTNTAIASYADWTSVRERLGLSGSLARTGPPEVQAVTKGPDGRPGRVLGVSEAGRVLSCHEYPVRYHPDRQTWIPIRDFDAEPGEDAAQPVRYWLGWYTGAAPGPADLERKQRIDTHVLSAAAPGMRVTLQDGNGWLIPMVALIPESWRANPGDYPEPLQIAMERVRRRLPDGARESSVKAQYVPLLEAVKVFARGAVFSPIQAEQPEIDAVADLALRANYRLGIDEAEALGLLSDRDVFAVALATLGLTPVKPGMDDDGDSEPEAD